MASFADLRANLNLNIQNFSDGLRDASRQTRRFAANLNGEINDASGAISRLNRSTTAWGLNIKSVSRVVSGIIISQAFYNAAQAIGGATNAAWEFTKQLEYAQIAYSNLFGDTSLALEFINVLKDFAAKTPFTFREAETSAKRLLAYGVQYENIMYVMQGVMSAASAQGDPARIEQISRAIGQIFTYGKLMTAEVRQLTEAGIPVYDILQEKLGLTQEQLRNLGHEAIPASKAINALIDGINERFGNVVNASSKTITGIISNIKDNATMLASGLMDPLTIVIKSALADVGEALFSLRNIMETSGAGGVFEALFPKSMHATLRQFAANFAAIHASGVALATALGGLLKPVLDALLLVYNALIPVLTTVSNALAGLVYGITQNATAMRVLTAMLAAAAAMWTVYKIRALASAAAAGAITLVSKALAGLSTMLSLVIAHPFWALLIGLTGVLVGISGGFGTLSEKVNGFFKSLTQFNGVDPDKILLPSQKERANDLDKFNEKLSGTADSMDDLADSTGKATKAAKGLLSFDEVFKLNEPDEGAGGGGISDAALDELLDGFGGLGGAYIPEIPDFSTYVDSVLGGLRDAWESIKKKAKDLVGAGIGAVLGAIIGGLLGGPIGAKIGAVIGALVGQLWKTFADKLGVVPEQHIGTIASSLGTGLITFLGSAIAQFAKGLVPTFTDDVFSGFSKMVGFSIRESLGKALKQGIVGAIVGLATGMLSNALAAWIAKELELTDADLKNAGVGQTIGSIIGSITGMLVGGPLGSLIGGALGQLAGTIVGEFWNYLSTTLKGSVIGGVAGLPIGALVGTIVGSIGGPLGAALGATIGTGLGSLVGVIVEHWEPISTFFVNAAELIKDTFNDWFGETINGIVLWHTNTLNELSTWWTETITGFTTWYTDTVTSLSDWFENTYKGFTTWFRDTTGSLSTWWSNTVSTFSDWSNINKDTLSTWWNETKSGFGEWFTNTFTSAVTWWTDTKKGFNDWSTNTKNKLNTWKQETILGFLQWVAETYLSIVTWKQDIEQRFNEWKDNVKKIIVQWSLDVITSIVGWIIDTTSKITNWISDIKNKFNTWKEDILRVITGFTVAALLDILGWVADTKKSITDWTTNIRDDIKKKFDDIDKKIGEFLNLDVSISTFCRNTLKSIKDWASDVWSSISDKFSKAIEKIKDFISASEEASDADTPAISNYSGKGVVYGSNGPGGPSLTGHATGGIFNREHIARFSEGNKAEMAIPLENNTAMQPFVDAISRGILEGLAPTLIQANSNNQANSMPPMYVGTLIADERGLKQLSKKLELIQVQENARKGLA